MASHWDHLQTTSHTWSITRVTYRSHLMHWLSLWSPTNFVSYSRSLRSPTDYISYMAYHSGHLQTAPHTWPITQVTYRPHLIHNLSLRSPTDHITYTTYHSGHLQTTSHTVQPITEVTYRPHLIHDLSLRSPTDHISYTTYHWGHLQTTPHAQTQWHHMRIIYEKIMNMHFYHFLFISDTFSVFLPEKTTSPMTAYFLCWMLLMLSKSASSTRSTMRPRNASTPIATPKPHAFGSLLYWHWLSHHPCDEMHPNTIIEKTWNRQK